MMSKDDFYFAWSKLHGDAKIVGIVKGWLSISFSTSKALARIRITPNALTILGLVFGVLLYMNANAIWAPLILVISLICDGVDGSLAIITGKSSKWGALLDSVVDRLTEVFWILALYSLGVDSKILIAVLILASAQEYLRARAGGVGLTQVGVVTVAERPVRASFVFIALVAFNLNLEILNQITFVWLILQAFSFLTVAKFVAAKLN
jgi:archaetidylinositol phosphate synthase